MSTPAPAAASKTRLPRPAQKQVDEANALLASLTTKPGEPTQTTPATSAVPEATPAAPVATPAATTPVTPVTPEPAATTTPAEPDYKQMYGVLKGKYDKEVPELRAQIGEIDEKFRQTEQLLLQANERITTSQQTHTAPKVGELPPPGSFTEEEMREYGPEFFNVVARRAQEIVDAQFGPLKKQLEEANIRAGRDAKIDAERARANLFLALDTEVPAWGTINTDPAFLAWLAETDVFSRQTKRELLTEAFQALDAARVVRFFKAFQEDSARRSTPAARIPSVDPGTLIAPGVPRNTGAPAAAPGGDDRVYTQQEIADFYTAARRGKIPPDEKARMEVIFTRAAAEGRVR